MESTTEAQRPRKLNVSRRADGRLTFAVDGKGAEARAVQAVCCFPWSRPNAYVSLRDDKGHEVAFIESLDELDDASRALITQELVNRLFMPRITAIESIVDDLELLHWKVVTEAGPRTFLTARGEPPRNLRNGMILVKDVANDLYVIKSTSDLDARSNRLLWAYLD